MKLLGLALVVAALVGSSGVGYAWCGGGGGGGCDSPGWSPWGHSCAPKASLVWTSPSGALPSPGTACTLTLTTHTLYVAASHLAPGEGCSFHAELKNAGTEGLSVTEVVTISEPATCHKFLYSDDLPTSSPLKIQPGHAFAYSASVTLSPSAGNACQGAVATFTVALTGSTESRCDHDDETVLGGSSSLPLWDCD